MINDSYFTSYWFYGDLYKLIHEKNNSDFYFANNFLNIYNSDGEAFELFFANEYINSAVDVILKCPYVMFREVDFYNSSLNWIDIKSYVDNGWNILLFVNRSYLSIYKNHSIAHQIMIYDYIDKSKELLFCDNNLNGCFSQKMKCTYEEFENGFNHVRNLYNPSEPWLSKFYLLKGVECDNYHFDIKRVITELKEYVGEKTYTLGHEIDIYNTFGGIQAYDGLIRNLHYRYQEFVSTLHLGAYAVLREHKNILYVTYKILVQKYGFDKTCLENITKIKNDITIILNMVLKYCISPTPLQIDSICKMLCDTKSCEKLLIENLINRLEGII